MTTYQWRSAYDQRARLVSLLQAHPVFARTHPPAPGQFPHDIKLVDPQAVDAATDVDIACVVPGQSTMPYTLGGAGVGKLTLAGQVIILIYVANSPEDMSTADLNNPLMSTADLASDPPVTPESSLTEKLVRSTLLGQLTMNMLQALFSFPVDPTPGDQMWNSLELAPTAMGLHTTFYETPVFHQSKTRVNLRGQMFRPGSNINSPQPNSVQLGTPAGPSGRPSQA